MFHVFLYVVELLIKFLSNSSLILLLQLVMPILIMVFFSYSKFYFPVPLVGNHFYLMTSDSDRMSQELSWFLPSCRLDDGALYRCNAL